MKNAFKPLAIAAAVTAVSASYTGVASAQQVANNALGDLALVPYYTVQDGWVTGVHVVNTSAKTQVVKFRLRRAPDSMDALDFNVVMSPQDVFAGLVTKDSDGSISFNTYGDTTCTVPAATDGKLTMPSTYADGAETGYIEVIGMGQPVEEETASFIAKAAKHGSNGVPADCAAVRSNFFADGVDTSTAGVINSASSYQTSATASLTGLNNFEGSDNALKVSYFIRDNDSGVEFGNNAVHIQNFLVDAAITNQQFGYRNGDLKGFDYPDLNGGLPNEERGKFDLLRRGSVLGVANLINEWSYNPANGVATDWVVTMPGQYTMLDLKNYDTDTLDCKVVSGSPLVCDYRDIPVVAQIDPYNREERTLATDRGELVVSPSFEEPQTLELEKEVNVITFGGESVLGVSDVDLTADLGQPFGWLSLAVTSSEDKTQSVCELSDTTTNGAETLAELTSTCTAVSYANVPMIGFAAWQRSVAVNPDASYGRIIEHSFGSAAD